MILLDLCCQAQPAKEFDQLIFFFFCGDQNSGMVNSVSSELPCAGKAILSYLFSFLIKILNKLGIKGLIKARIPIMTHNIYQLDQFLSGHFYLISNHHSKYLPCTCFIDNNRYYKNQLGQHLGSVSS